MINIDKRGLIEELYHKHKEFKNGVYVGDRVKMQKEYFEVTGEEITSSTLSNYIRDIDKDIDYSNQDLTKYSEDSNGNITSEIRKRMRAKLVYTNRELLELHSINPDENQIKQIISNEWTMTNKDGMQYYNFQSKIIAVPIGAEGLTFEEFFKQIKEPPVKFKKRLIGIGTRNLVIGLADLHFGPTTVEQLEEELSEICEIVENGYDTIVIEQLGDLFESSQMKDAVTLKGTILPTVDMVKALRDAKQFFHQLIDHCIEHCNNVKIEHACGNHSGNFEYFFMDSLKDRYELLNEGRVQVNNHNEWRSAYQLGNVGIMISHGDTVPLKRLVGMFANEFSLLWGNVEHREVHTGHKHNKFTDEEVDGAVCRQFPTPKITSDYERKFGYTSRKMIQLIEYDEDKSKVIYEIG